VPATEDVRKDTNRGKDAVGEGPIGELFQMRGCRGGGRNSGQVGYVGTLRLSILSDSILM
jgi:hypothetical protein